MDTRTVKVSQDRPGAAGGRRIYVNGKLLTYKQTAQFEKFIQDPSFREKFQELMSA